MFQIRLWKKVYDSPNPHLEKYPDQWGEELTKLQDLLLLRCLRPDKVRNDLFGFATNETISQKGRNDLIGLTTDEIIS